MKKQKPRYTRTLTIVEDRPRKVWWVVEKDGCFIGRFSTPRRARHFKRQWYLYMNTPYDHIAYQYLNTPCPSK